MLIYFLFVGTQLQKVPVNQMVRTDSRNPFGRLHSYWKDEAQSSKQEKKSDLVSMRYVYITFYKVPPHSSYIFFKSLFLRHR